MKWKPKSSISKHNVDNYWKKREGAREVQEVPRNKKPGLNPKERRAIQMAPLLKEKKKEGHFGLEEVTTLTLRLISPSLKVNWTRIFSRLAKDGGKSL